MSAVFFACILPFARMPLPPVPAFVASYQSALAISDLLTAILLFSQFAILRSRALLLLASGYLFTAIAAVVHGLTFPGLFTAGGLLNAGPQTTAWLYMVWHGAFPVFVLGYALLKDKDGGREIRGSIGGSVLGSVIAVCVAMAAVLFVVTDQHDILPRLMDEDSYAPALFGISMTVWSVSLAALLVMCLRRPHSLLDAARFDLGFYVGRLYGLCAACFVLAVLLLDNFALQARLSRLLHSLRRQAVSDQQRHTERERLFSAVVESSNDAIITKTLDGTITAWNRAAERLFGFTATEAVGKRIDIIVPPERHAEVNEILYRIARGEAIEHYETFRMDRNGREIPVSLAISPLRSLAGEIIGASKIARDITESIKTQAALNQEIEERRHIFETSQD